MRTLTLFVLLLVVHAVSAQQGHRPWEEYLHEVMTMEDDGTVDWEDLYDQLCDLEQHPLDLNRATREQLEEIPFLSAQQVEEIVAYQYRYGPLKSLAELMMVKSLDYNCRRLLSCFVFVGEPDERRRWPSWKDIAKYGKNELTATCRLPLYRRKGDRNGYLGYPYRHWLRYQFSCRDNLKIGLVGAQDAGEPFFAHRNKTGYDYYSYYLQLWHLGRVETAALGKYRIGWGMGLTVNNGFSLGKLSMLQNLGRAANTLKAHASRSSDFLQGLAATITLGKHLKLTSFLSYRPADATLNKDGTVSSIVTTGYHRTESEMEKKGNLHQVAIGGSVRYSANGLHLGVNGVWTHLDRPLSPNTSVLYRQHYPQGQNFTNLSADYTYATPRFSFSGETAVCQNGGLATINSISLQLTDGFSLLALQRFYSYRYTALYARSFSEGGYTRNESGLYLGLTWQPSPRWHWMVYGDYAYFPWARYQVSQSSHAWDCLSQLSYSHREWKLSARYRLRHRQRDNDQKDALVGRTEHRARLTLDYQTDAGWSSKTQADGSAVNFAGWQYGFMISQTAGYTYKWLRLNGGIGYFHTDNYDTRVSLYELGPLYTYAISQFQGEGIRCWLMARAALGHRLSLTAKYGMTQYFDRSQIGSGLQTINGSGQAEFDVQLRWVF